MRGSIDSGKGDDLSALHDLWDVDTASYKGAEGDKVKEITLDGKNYQVVVKFLDLEGVNLDNCPTNRRVVTQIAPNLNAVHDIVVPVLPGWGETSAQFEGDFLVSLLRALREHGYENPKIVGVNCSGRGTEEYLADPARKKISRIGLHDEMEDAYQLALALDEQGFLGDNMMIVGHSMGALNATTFLGALAVEQLAMSEMADISNRVRSVVQLMPVTDKPYGMFRPGFLLAVRNQVIPALWQYFSRRGYLKLNQKDHSRMMFSDAAFDEEHYRRGVPDSARRFLELTFNPSRKFDGLLRSGLVDRVRFSVVEGARDTLVPSSVVRGYARDLKDRVDGVVDGYFMGSFAHAVPFEMNFQQKSEMARLWNVV